MVVGAIRRFFFAGSGAAVLATASGAAGALSPVMPKLVVPEADPEDVEGVGADAGSALRFRTPALDARGSGRGVVATAGEADGRTGVRPP